jgi:hypothetical protein
MNGKGENVTASGLALIPTAARDMTVVDIEPMARR